MSGREEMYEPFSRSFLLSHVPPLFCLFTNRVLWISSNSIDIMCKRAKNRCFVVSL